MKVKPDAGPPRTAPRTQAQKPTRKPSKPSKPNKPNKPNKPTKPHAVPPRGPAVAKPPLLQSARFRWISFSLVLLVVTALSAVFVVRAINDQQRRLIPTAATKRDRALDLGSVLDAPHIVFRSTSPGPTYGIMAAVPLTDPSGNRSVSNLSCERVYANGVAGICLSADRGVLTTYKGELLDGRLAPVGELPVNGSPSRARLSSDGSLSSSTVFLAGHGYGTIGFSTETVIYDRSRHYSYGNLEKTFTTVINGKRSTAADLNVWGVTFEPGPKPTKFYATVATGGTTWLAAGDLAKRTLSALQTDVECPSLSPDGKVIVFKKRNGSPIKWRYHALDLTTGRIWPLAETRSVDDQAEWVDDSHVVYGLQRSGTGQSDVWQVAVRGTAKPTILIPDASSPAVVHAAAPPAGRT